MAFRPLMQTIAEESKIQVQVDAVRQQIAHEAAHGGGAAGDEDLPGPGTGPYTSAPAAAAQLAGSGTAGNRQASVDKPMPPLPVSQMASDGVGPSGAPLPYISSTADRVGSSHIEPAQRGASGTSVTMPPVPAGSLLPPPAPQSSASSSFKLPLPTASQPISTQSSTSAEVQQGASHSNTAPMPPAVVAPPPAPSSGFTLPLPPAPVQRVTSPVAEQPLPQQADEEEDMFAGCEMQGSHKGGEDSWGAPVQALPVADQIEDDEWHTVAVTANTAPIPDAPAAAGSAAAAQQQAVPPPEPAPEPAFAMPSPAHSGFADLAAHAPPTAPAETTAGTNGDGEGSTHAASALPPATPPEPVPQLQAEPVAAAADGFTDLASTIEVATRPTDDFDDFQEAIAQPEHQEAVTEPQEAACERASTQDVSIQQEAPQEQQMLQDARAEEALIVAEPTAAHDGADCVDAPGPLEFNEEPGAGGDAAASGMPAEDVLAHAPPATDAHGSNPTPAPDVPAAAAQEAQAADLEQQPAKDPFADLALF